MKMKIRQTVFDLKSYYFSYFYFKFRSNDEKGEKRD